MAIYKAKFSIISTSIFSLWFRLHNTAAENYRGSIPLMEFNRMKFTNVTAKAIRTDAPGFGSGILKYGKVTLDYMNKKFYLEPYQHISEINMQKKQWTVDPVIDNEKRVVGIIWDQDIAKGINTGDEMISFDGLDYQKK